MLVTAVKNGIKVNSNNVQHNTHQIQDSSLSTVSILTLNQGSEYFYCFYFTYKEIKEYRC